MSKDGKSKVDLFSIQSSLESDVVNVAETIFSQDGQISVVPNNSTADKMVAYHRLLENVTGIIQKQTQITRNRGIDSLKIGYPLISYQTKTSQSDCFLAPILLISIKIDASTRKIEIINSNSLVINPNFITAIQNNNLQIQIENTLKLINESASIIEITSKFIQENGKFLENHFSEQIQKIPFQSKLDLFSKAEDLPKFKIYNSGIISNFIGSNVGIINDLKSYTSGIEDVTPFNFQIRQNPIQNLDPSQLHTIESFNKKKHLIIHGPPGTGKSQTITGIITSALAEKKTVLVVCEKRAALDVIYSNLAKENLETYTRTITNIDTDQSRIVREIRNSSDNFRTTNSRFTINQDNLNREELNLSKKIQDLVKSKMVLSWDIIPKNKWKDLVGRALNTADYTHINVSDSKITSWLPQIDSVISECERSVDLGSKIHNLQLLNETINFDNESIDIISEINTINSLLEQYASLLQEEKNHESDAITNLQSEFEALSKKINDTKTGLHDYENKVNNIRNLYTTFFQNKTNLKSIKFNDIQYSLNDIVQLEVNLKDAAEWAFEQSSEFLKERKTNFLKYIFEQQYRTNKSKYKKIKKIITEKYDENIIQIISQLIQKSGELKRLLIELQTKCGNNYESYCIQEKKSIFQTEITIAKIELLLNSRDSLSFETIKNIIQNDYTEKVEKTKHKIAIIIKKITNSEVLTKQFRESFFNNVEDFHNRIKKLYDVTTEIIHYAQYRTIVSDIFGNVNLHPTINALRLFYHKLSKYKLREFNQVNSSLIANNEDLIRQINNQTKSSQNDTKLLAKKFLTDSFKEGMKDATRFSTIFAQRGPNRKSLREICQRHQDAFIKCCPVLLTTPDVVSTLFTGKSDIYDIIIFDEASQIEVHNSIGAFQKGKVKIVAGDQHQMPPSSYFLKRSNNENFENEEVNDDLTDQEQQSFIDVESLLDFCISNQNQHFESKYLDFHYRSEHPALIRFSNEAIYKRLVIKPTYNIDYKPFEFVYQSNGIWENGENPHEATSVIEIISGLNISTNKTPVVLVGTLNINQANLISKLITSKRISDNNFDKKFIELENSGFAVVNLEHLQGDECDIMILSTGYGPNRDGAFRSQFIFRGTNGYRLLNVAITRARYKNIIVTSIPKSFYQDYLTYLSNEEINPKTRGLFYAFINYVEAMASNNTELVESICGNINKYFLANNNLVSDADGEFESPFEEEVFNVLLSRFESSEITLQENHEKSGFRIDMVIRPKHCPWLKIAIECDGATYHSGWSNQILDNHRQSLLERAQYKFIRIWSTDWWQNTEGAQMSLFNKINEILDNSSQHDIPKISWLDDIVFTSTPNGETQNQLHQDIVLIDEDNDDSTISQNIVFTKKISRSCSVRLVNNIGVEKFFSISDYNQNSGNFMNADAPLARLLFDKQVGESITFNNSVFQVLEII
jgi:very-short-patch-repair endonuclease/DNA polymerase III delta prime subunit